MRGLAFPSTAVYDRETSYEYGTPFSNPDDIPIDPALGGMVIDPAILAEENGMHQVQVCVLSRSSKTLYQPLDAVQTRRVLTYKYR